MSKPASSLSIYDAPVAPAVLVPEQSPLEPFVNQTRTATNDFISQLALHANLGLNKVHAYENSGYETVSSIVSNEPNLKQGAPYVGVATLAGSIIARNRNIALRFLTPAVLFGLSLSYYLPTTYRSLESRVESFEKANAPALYDAHQSLKARFNQLKQSASEAAK